MFELRVLVGRSSFSWGNEIPFAVYGIDPQNPNAVAIGQPIEMKSEEMKGTGNKEPPVCFRLARSAAQSLMDELWSIGCRPNEEGSPGQLAAIRSHLEDMRAFAFKKAGVEMPRK